MDIEKMLGLSQTEKDTLGMIFSNNMDMMVNGNAALTIKNWDKTFQDLIKWKAKQEPTWISVNDRLPEGGKEVDAYSKEYGRVCNVTAMGMMFYDGVFGATYIDATHWMDKPEPPKEGE